MSWANRHPWRGEPWIEPKKAVALQKKLASRVREERGPAKITRVCGVDIGVRGDLARAALCVYRFPELELLEVRTAVRPLEFPYIPGLLAFREVPAILEAYRKLETEPDVLLVDGHGLAHPRRFGSACYLGVELDRPAIGCGKSLLCGSHREPGPKRGAQTQLLDGKERIGFCVRTREGVKPVYISVGHRLELVRCVKIILACTPRYRLPEPIRAADRAAGTMDETGCVPADVIEKLRIPAS